MEDKINYSMEVNKIKDELSLDNIENSIITVLSKIDKQNTEEPIQFNYRNDTFSFIKFNEIIPVTYSLTSNVNIDNFKVMVIGKIGFDYVCIDYSFSNKGRIIKVDSTVPVTITTIAENIESFLQELFENNPMNLLEAGISAKDIAMVDTSTNNKNLQAIEETFTEILNNADELKIGKKSPYKYFDTIRRALNNEFKCNCVEVRVDNTVPPTIFFGCSIKPTLSALSDISTDMVKSIGGEKVKFTKCKEFYIDFDPKMLYNTVFTAEELTACLLHEIGHKVFDVNLIRKLTAKFSYELSVVAGTSVNFAINIMGTLNPLKFLLYQLILNTFTSTYHFAKGIKKEIDADSLAIRYGYGVHLYSALDKIEKIGTLSQSEKDNDMLIRWTVDSIINFNLRKQKILSTLKRLSNQSRNKTEKDVYLYQIGEINKIKYVNANSPVNESNTFFNESLLLENLNAYIKKLSNNKIDSEMDMLLLDIANMQDNDDKVYCIIKLQKLKTNAIKNQIELKKLYENGKISERDYELKNKLIENHINYLDSLRTQVHTTKIKDKTYGVFAKIGIDGYDY